MTTPRDWDAPAYDRLSAPVAAMGLETLDRLELEGDETVLDAPPGVTLLDDVETVIATITPPTLEPVEEDIETETELVGEDGEPIEAPEGEAEGEAAEEGAEPAAESDES